MIGRELFRFDPRTVLIVIVALNVVMFSAGFTGLGALARIIFTLVPAIMAIGVGRAVAALLYLTVCAFATIVEQVVLQSNLDGFALVVTGIAGLIARLAPGLFLAYVAIVSIKSGEMMSALEQWKVPRQIVIPTTVILRFIPTVREELGSIATAMTARGLSLHKTGLSRWIEYRLVPLMISCVKTGEELTQAALTRGLGRPGAVQRISNPTMKWHDGALLTLCGAGVVVWCVS